MATVMTSPSKKRYDKQALEQHNRCTRFNDLYYINSAQNLREIMVTRYNWIKKGDVEWLQSYFFWRKQYKDAVLMANKWHHSACLPIPG